MPLDPKVQLCRRCLLVDVLPDDLVGNFENVSGFKHNKAASIWNKLSLHVGLPSQPGVCGLNDEVVWQCIPEALRDF